MLGTQSSVFHFADVEVREREFRITKSGQVLQVEPKAFRVLLLLLHNPQKLIAKDELLNAIWGDAAVTENSLTRAIALLRHLLGDDTHQPRFIETVSTVGYRFICKLEVVERTGGGLSPADPPETRSEPVPNNEAAAVEAKTQRTSMLRHWRLAAAVAIVVGLLASTIWYLHRPLPPPRVTAYAQITHDGHEKELAARTAAGSTSASSRRIPSLRSQLQGERLHRFRLRSGSTTAFIRETFRRMDRIC